MTTTAVRQTFQRLIPEVLKVIGFSEFKNFLRRPYEENGTTKLPSLKRIRVRALRVPLFLGAASGAFALSSMFTDLSISRFKRFARCFYERRKALCRVYFFLSCLAQNIPTKSLPPA
jgi:hypothetical protein